MVLKILESIIVINGFLISLQQFFHTGLYPHETLKWTLTLEVVTDIIYRFSLKKG